MTLRFDISGPEVAALHQRLLKMGAEISRSELDAQHFGDSTRNAVVALQRRNAVVVNGIVDAATEALLAAGAGLVDTPARIRGQVTWSDGTPYDGATVRAFTKTLRGEQQLGHDTNADETGWYSLEYQRMTSVDVFVRIFDEGNRPLQESAVVFRAPSLATLDITLPGVAPGRTEFERIATRLAPSLQGHEPESLTANETQFLNQSTGIDATHIEHYALARRLAGAYELPTEVFYALARAGLLPIDGLLTLRSAQQLHSVLDDAVKHHVIPPSGEDLAEKLISRIQDRLLTPSLSPVAKTLTAADLDLGLQRRVIDALMRTEGPPVEVWQKLEADATVGAAAAKRARLALRLGAMTSHHAPLVKALLVDRNIGAIEDLAQLSPADWTALVTTVGAPEGISGDHPEASVQTYAQALYRAVEEALPTPTFAARLRTAAKELTPPTSFAAAHAHIADFLEAHPDFDLARGHVERAVSRASVTSESNKPLREDVQRVQRLFRVSPRYDDVSALAQAGFRSATAIVHFGIERFIAQHGEALGGAERARALFGRASAQHALALTRFGRFSRAMNPIDLPALPTPASQLTSRLQSHAALSNGLPDYADLFGPLKLCDCDQCRSVLSPSAYLVDLLSFLHTIPLTDGSSNTALDLLLKRRPELTQIDLTCANSNTPFPLVDLINEILESSTALDNIRRIYFNTQPITDRQTTRDAATLTVAPEYVNRAVYETLLPVAASPWDLPFDLGTEQARAYLGQLGITRDAIMQAFQGSAGPSDADIAADALGLSVVEHWIITHGAFDLKAPVKVAAGSAIVLTSPPSTIDGIALTEGDRLLLLAQADAAANGIYVLSAGTLTRASDAANGSQLHLGSAVVVQNGSLKGRTFVLTTYVPITIGTTPLHFEGEFGFWNIFLTLFNIDPAVAFASDVGALLKSANIDVPALQALLQTRYINPNNTLALVFGTDSNGVLTCDLSKATITGLASQPATALRMLRFLRLQRRLGWSAHEIDLVLSVLRRGEIDDPFLVGIVELRRIAGRLDLSVSEVAAFWGNIDTTDPQTSLYELVFRNRSVVDPPPAFLTLNDQRSELATTGQKLSVNRLGLLAPLGITAADFDLLVPALVPDSLTLANLSALYRYSRLAHAAEIPIADLVHLLLLTDIQPFDPAHPGNVRLLLDRLDFIENSGFSVVELRYLLQQQDSEASGLAPDNVATELLMMSLRDGLNAAATAAATPLVALDALTLTQLVRNALALAHPAPPPEPALAIIQGTTPLSAADQIAFINQYFDPFWPKADAIATLVSANPPLPLRERLEEALGHLTGDQYLDPLLAALQRNFGALFPAPLSAQLVDAARGRLPAAQTSQLINDNFGRFLDPNVLAQAQVALAVAAGPAPQGHTLRARLEYVLSYLAPDDVVGAAIAMRPREAVKVTAAEVVLSLDAATLTSLVRDGLSRVLPATQLDTALAIVQGTSALDAAAQAAFITQYFDPFWSKDDAIAELVTAQPPVPRDRLEDALGHLTDDHYLDPLIAALQNSLAKVLPGSQVARAMSLVRGQLAPGDAPQAVNDTFGSPDPNSFVANFSTFLGAENAYPLFVATLTPQGSPRGRALRARLELVLPYLGAYLFHSAARSLLVQKLGATLGVQPRVLNLMLDHILAPEGVPGIPPRSIYSLWTSSTLLDSDNDDSSGTDFTFSLSSYVLLAKAATIVTRLEIHDESLARPAGFDGPETLHWSLLPIGTPTTASTFFDDWRRLVEVIGLARKQPGGRENISAVLLVGLTTYIARLFGVAEADVSTIVTVLGLTPLACTDVDNVLRIGACLKLVKRCNTSAATLTTWTGPYVPLAVADQLKQAVKTHYDSATWLAVAKPIQDQLREKQRTALTAFYNNFSPDFTTQTGAVVPAWSDYFLIDLETSPVVQTSRIQNATLTIQRLVQRSFLDLEPFRLSADQTTQWQWMSQFPLWMANRQVFLYPENWIQPELRSDKSELFQALEKSLVQQDLTSELAEDAIAKYLDGLGDLANLVVLAEESEFKLLPFPDLGSYEIRHVIARTPFHPYRYFYRNLNTLTSIWTPWSKIDVDIESDQVIFYVALNRLFLFWLIFKQQGQDSQSTPAQETQTNQNLPRTMAIKLAWSEYKRGKWTTKQTTPDDLAIDTADIVKSLGFLLNHRDDPGQRDGFASLSDPTHVACGLLQSPRLGVQLQFRSMLWDGQRYSFAVYQASFLLSRNPDTGAPLSTGIERIPFSKITNPRPIAPALPQGNMLTDDPSVSTPAPYQFDPITSTSLLATPPTHYSSLSSAATYFQDHNRCFRITLSLTSSAALAATSPAASLSAPMLLPAHSRGVQLAAETSLTAPGLVAITPNDFTTQYDFTSFYHPYVSLLLGNLNDRGADGVFTRAVEGTPATTGGTADGFFNSYGPNSAIVGRPREEIDFSLQGAYSFYNWELFFHVPLLVAKRLMQNQRFADAQRWLHYLFNPTDSSNDGPHRFWTFYPFFVEFLGKPIEDLLEELDNPADPDFVAMLAAVHDWQLHPFDPHRIARLRISAYAKNVFMAYLDNLIAWGDSLFRQNSTETINQAVQLYLLAGELLGERPQDVTLPAEPQAANYQELVDKNALDAFSNAIVPYENLPGPATGGGTPIVIGKALEFCIPKNDKLLGYWDTVADRLFKIRHSMTIDGVVEQLPLFPPPIDPALLVAAQAAGLDLSNVLSDSNAQLPSYRFTVMLQKANELCAEVKALGQQLLSALEKRDAEALALLRSTQELSLLQAIRENKVRGVDEAQAQLDAQLRARDSIQLRFDFYHNIESINKEEQAHLDSMSQSLIFHGIANLLETLSAEIRLIPSTNIGISGVASSPVSTVEVGGPAIGGAMSAHATAFGAVAAALQTSGEMQRVHGGYRRRSDEWKLQESLASTELRQADRAIAGARIRLAVAQKDLDNHDLQIANAQAIDQFMNSKFTNQDLYDYLVRELSSTYFQTYQLAFSLAKKAQRAYQHEIGDSSTSFVQFGYWDNLRKGLTAGEKLQLDLRRLESSYLDRNVRELEMTKDISLALLSPEQLLQLREAGSCQLALPESLFDYDYPGHYFRRLKSVSLSLPCVTGPYTNVNCTLTLLSDKLRVSTVGSKYPELTDQLDKRFVTRTGAVQAIATSSGQSDSGLFEVNFHDERYLPFEGAGAISTWRLDLPLDTNLFDRQTLTDVILHVRYTARDGGEGLRSLVSQQVVRARGRTALVILSVAQQLKTAWEAFLHPGDGPTDKGQALALDLDAALLPFALPGKTPRIKNIGAVLKLSTRSSAPGRATVADQYDDSLILGLSAPSGAPAPSGTGKLTRDPRVGGLPHAIYGFSQPAQTGLYALAIQESDLSGSAAALSDILWTISPGGHNRLIPDAIDDILVIVEVALT